MKSAEVNNNVERQDIEDRVVITNADGSSSWGWKSYIWDSEDKSPEEKRLIRKIDLTLVTFGCLGTFIKFIDKANLQTAYVSGMEEDLGFYGNQLNYANTAYSVATILGLWPSNLILTRTNPQFFIPFIEFGWTICTFAQAKMTNTVQMCVLRALIGLFETGHYSALMFLCGSWYQKRELARRMAIINMAAQAGPMFSSYLQTAAYDGLNGVRGLAGWQWLFIIDGVISAGIIIPQLIFLPDVPARLKPNFMFSVKEIEMARDRMPQEGRVRQGAFTRTQVWRWFTTPEIWLLWFIAVCQNIGYTPYNSIAFWFKAWNTIKPNSFTVAQINDYVTPANAITIVITTTYAWTSDTLFRGRRWPALIIGGAVNFLVCILLAATPVFPKNRAFRWFLYYQTGWGEASNCMFWAWTQDLLAGDPATRAFASAGLTTWPGVAAATIPLAVFQTVQQPAVVSGNYTAAAFWVGQVVATLVLCWRLGFGPTRAAPYHAEEVRDDSVRNVAGTASSSDGELAGKRDTEAVTVIPKSVEL